MNTLIHPQPLIDPDHNFSHSADTLRQLAHDMLQYAKQQGATACAAEVSDGFGQAVTVRNGEVETIEYNRDKGLAVSVFLGQRRGNASTSDFSPEYFTAVTMARSRAMVSVIARSPSFRCAASPTNAASTMSR